MGFYEISTSDRIAFKRCRRKWDFSSSLRKRVVPANQPTNVNLWFGTGFHFALEDYHGYNIFKDPCKALDAYYNAFESHELPEGAKDKIELGKRMFAHYLNWDKLYQNQYETVWLEKAPLVEQNFYLELIELTESVGVPVYYKGTIDRLVIDASGNYWIQDYKTTAQMDTSKLLLDPQISAYIWATEQYYQVEVEGVIYTQFAKKAPEPPQELKKGGFSKSKAQSTTFYLYRDTLLKAYDKIPEEYTDILNHLDRQITDEGDQYIRTDKVVRNRQSKESTYRHIVAEAKEMLDPELNTYPNPTRDCSWDCPYMPLCLLMDEGGDWEYQLENFYKPKDDARDAWKLKIPELKREES